MAEDVHSLQKWATARNLFFSEDFYSGCQNGHVENHLTRHSTAEGSGSLVEQQDQAFGEGLMEVLGRIKSPVCPLITFLFLGQFR